MLESLRNWLRNKRGIRVQVDFVPHCENWDCDLGCAFYHCPKCDKTQEDYNVWWRLEEPWFKFQCQNCQARLLRDVTPEAG